MKLNIEPQLTNLPKDPNEHQLQENLQNLQYNQSKKASGEQAEIEAIKEKQKQNPLKKKNSQFRQFVLDWLKKETNDELKNVLKNLLQKKTTEEIIWMDLEEILFNQIYRKQYLLFMQRHITECRKNGLEENLAFLSQLNELNQESTKNISENFPPQKKQQQKEEKIQKKIAFQQREGDYLEIKQFAQYCQGCADLKSINQQRKRTIFLKKSSKTMLMNFNSDKI